MTSYLVIVKRVPVMGVFANRTKLPAWAYAAIAAIPISILLVFYARLDTLSRVELAIPAAFWTVAFVAIAWRRARHR